MIHDNLKEIFMHWKVGGKPHGNIVNSVMFLNDEENGDMLMLLVWFFLLLLVDDMDSNNEIDGQKKYNDEVENVHKDEDDNN